MNKSGQRGIVQFIKFNIVGASNAVVDLGSLNLLLFLFPTENKAILVLLNTIAFVLTVTNSYIWNSRFTFKHASGDSNMQKLTFAIQALVTLGISNLVFYVGLRLLVFLPFSNVIINNSAKLISMALSSLSSFFFMKYFVFKKKNRQVTNE